MVLFGALRRAGVVCAVALFALVAFVSAAPTMAAPGPADVSVTNVVNTTFAINEGLKLTYTITVKNNDATNDATGVTLSDTLPANTVFYSFTQTSGPAFTLNPIAVRTAGTVTATAATLAPGATAVFKLAVRITCNVPDFSTIQDTATVSTTTTDANSANNSSSQSTTAQNEGSGNCANIEVTRTFSPSPVPPGSNLVVTVTATNDGLNNASSGTLTISLSTGATFVSMTQSGTGPNYNCTTPAVGASGGTVNCNSTTGPFPLDAQTNLIITVNVPAATANGTSLGYLISNISPNMDGVSLVGGSVTVQSSGPATHFVVSAPATATAGTAVSVTVTAQDASNITASGYTGTVTFTSTDAQAALPANTTLTNGTGTFSVTLKTPGTQTVTATDTANSSITGTSGNITVSPGAATHFTVSAPASATAGTALNYTVTAQDSLNNTATNYTGTVQFTSTDAQASLPGSSALTNGAGSFSATLKTAGNQTVTATDTGNSSITGTSGTIVVSAGAATHLSVSAPASTTAGTAISVTVTAQDGFNNTDTSYSGTVQFTSTDAQAILPGNSALTNGAGLFSVILKTVGNQTVTATDAGNSSITGTSNTITVNPGVATHFTVTAPGSANAGTAFSYTVTARDALNNTVTGYGGTVQFTSTDGQATLAANGPLTNGTGTFSATLKTAGNQTITVTDTGNAAITGISGTIVVSTGAASHFTVSVPASATAGTAFSLTVTAQDAFDNTVTGYAGAVTFTSTDAQASLPANGPLTNGVGTFSATLKTAGSRTITATDTGNAAITGTSNAITVSPTAAAHFAVTAPASANAGVAFNITVTAQDQFDNTATAYGGTVHVTSTDSAATLPTNGPLTNGVGTFSVTLVTSGNRTVTATDTVTSSITGTSGTIAVSAFATHLSVTAPTSATAGTAFSVTVTALDAFNNTATSYGGTVHFTGTDAQAVLPANATLTNGVGTFSVTLKTVGNQTVTATDTVTATITGVSTAIAVSPGAATHFSIVQTSGTSTTASTKQVTTQAPAGISVTFTITALDQFGNVATGYTGTVHFTSSDPAALLPPDTTFTPADHGVKTVTVTFNTPGNQTLSATDTGNASIAGSASNIVVAPAVVTGVTVTAGHSTVKVGEPLHLTATATLSNSTMQDVTGSATWSSSDPNIASVDASATITPRSPGTVTLTATINGKQGQIQVTVSPPTLIGVQPVPAPASRPGAASAPSPPSGAPSPAPAPAPTGR